MQPRSLDDYIKHADDLAQDVVNAWSVNVSAGNATALTPDFKALFEAACQYRTAKEIAENHCEFDSLTEEDATNEKATRQSFAMAYKKYWEKYAVAF